MLFVTFVTLLVGLTTLPTEDGAVVTLSETYTAEDACALRLPALRQIVDTLTASGIVLLDGAGCLPIADTPDADTSASVLVASR